MSWICPRCKHRTPDNKINCEKCSYIKDKPVLHKSEEDEPSLLGTVVEAVGETLIEAAVDGLFGGSGSSDSGGGFTGGGGSSGGGGSEGDW